MCDKGNSKASVSGKDRHGILLLLSNEVNVTAFALGDELDPKISDALDSPERSDLLAQVVLSDEPVCGDASGNVFLEAPGRDE